MPANFKLLHLTSTSNTRTGQFALRRSTLLFSSSFLSILCRLPLTILIHLNMADVANLESAFERITVTDENDDQPQVPSTTSTYHKQKVDLAFVHRC